MKSNFNLRFPALLISSMLTFSIALNAQRVTIIESASSAAWAHQDTIWRSVADSLGFDAQVVQQSALDSLDSLANADILIVSSGLEDFIGTNHLQTVISFVESGRPAYIQAEYQFTLQGDKTFAALMDSIGENFTWDSMVSGDLAPMLILPPFSQYPDTVSAINYFNYGVTGSGGQHIAPFLEYQRNYYGFFYHDTNSCNGNVITCSDEDWVWADDCPALMTNIVYRLVNQDNCNTGIKSNTLTNLSIAPNPTYNSWQVSGLPLTPNSSIQIFDVSGRLVYTTPVTSDKMNISPALNAGVYLMEIVSGAGRVTRKLVHL